MDRITSKTRLLALAPNASLDLVDTETGEILSTIPLLDTHSRGGQYLGLCGAGQHLEAGEGVVALAPPERCRPMVPDNIFESGANPDYAPSDLDRVLMRQEAQLRAMQDRQLDLERSLMVQENVRKNAELVKQRIENPEPEVPLAPASPTDAPVVEA